MTVCSSLRPLVGAADSPVHDTNRCCCWLLPFLVLGEENKDCTTAQDEVIER